MAESHFSLFGPCTTYSALLDRNCVASSEYYAALSELVLLAGTENGALFAEAKLNCQICLRNCKRTTAAMRAHKAAHRC